MARADLPVTEGGPRIVGSFGCGDDLRQADAASVRDSCDIAEIRLDLIMNEAAGVEPALWRHLPDIPLLFTARRQDEGGLRALGAADRTRLLESVLDQAAWIDIEVASIGEMGGLLEILTTRGVPWIASLHDFERLPDTAVLENAVNLARDAGASVFKAAARLCGPADLASLAGFQLADHGLPVATMGMGPLAAVSRLLCAQCGSVLNYGYLGKTATAPGQWNAALLKETIARLEPWRA